MAALLIGIISAAIGAVLTAFAGHGLAVILLAYILCGISGMILGAWHQIITAEKTHDTKSGVNKTFIPSKNKT